MTEDIKTIIDNDRKELLGGFCRGCGYCMPCPVGIEINNCARMIQMIRRSPSAAWLTPANQAKMLNIENCIECGQCKSKCPFGLDTPQLLKLNLEDYKNILSGKTKV
jgi:predicted aldo/keto reductase-like oxidoreductase